MPFQKGKKEKCPKGKKPKEPPPPGEKLPEPPAGRLAQGGEKRGRWWERRRAEGSAEALAVRVAQRGHEVSELYCSKL